MSIRLNRIEENETPCDTGRIQTAEESKAQGKTIKIIIYENGKPTGATEQIHLGKKGNARRLRRSMKRQPSEID